MKKLLALILGLSMAMATCTSCSLLGGSGNTSNSSVSAGEVEEKSYTVTFRQMGEADVTMTVKEGDALTDIPTPKAKEGYTVMWKATDIAKLSSVKSNVVVEAVFEANTYTITFVAGEGVTYLENKKVIYNSDYSLADPTREGYTFSCWLDEEGNAVAKTGKWMTAKNVTLTAQWEAVQAEMVTVTFVQAGKTPVVREVEKGTACTDIPNVVEETGYTIVWDADALAALGNVTTNVTVNAVKTAKVYNVTFVDAEGIVTEPTTVTYNDAYDFTPNQAPTGYHFKGFTKGGETFTAYSGTNWNIAEDVELTVVWEADTYTVTLNADGGSCAPTITVTYGETYTLPTPTKSGYKFDGWYQGSTKVALTGTWTITGASIELKAKWKSDDGEWTKNY